MPGMELNSIRMSRALLLLFSISLTFIKTYCHPQCLDFRPPFKSDETLKTCPEYSNFGCCSSEIDKELGKKLNMVLSRGPSRNYERCKDRVREVLCLSCSPYAAHIFDSESDMIASILPSLCRPQCKSFYRECKGFIPFITNNASLGFKENDINTEEKFCDAVRITDMDYCYPNLTTNPIFTNEVITSSSTEEGCLCLEKFAENLRNPLIFRRFPDGSGRIAIAEQVGVVHIYHQNGSKISDSFMDITDDVFTSSYEGDERGFLGLEFHPKFAENRKFYCYFSVQHKGQQKIRVSEFAVKSSNANRADETSEKVILEVDQPFWNHNGGEIMFGYDGYLYLFLGDGGHRGDPSNYAQNKSTLLGKVLRIDVDVPPDSTRPYAIPPDNPFIMEEKARPEIYAYGVRNMWRCDLDEGDPVTGENRGRIICGDVGQDAMEEVDVILPGGNYGWSAREGFRCFKEQLCNKIGPEILPIFAYNHTVGKSVTGGHVYRGCLNPALSGRYIFGDFVRGRLFQLEEGEAGEPWRDREIKMCGTDVCFNGLLNSYETNILSFGEDEDGEIYMLATTAAITSKPSGSVYKLVDPRRRGDPTKCRSFKRQLREQPPAVTTLPTESSTIPQQGISSGSSRTFPNFRLLPQYLTITTCVLIPAVSCVTYYI